MTNVFRNWRNNNPSTIIDKLNLSDKNTAQCFLELMLDSKKPDGIILDFPTPQNISMISNMMRDYAVAFAALVKDGIITTDILNNQAVDYYIQRANENLSESNQQADNEYVDERIRSFERGTRFV